VFGETRVAFEPLSKVVPEPTVIDVDAVKLAVAVFCTVTLSNEIVVPVHTHVSPEGKVSPLRTTAPPEQVGHVEEVVKLRSVP